jgi:hypothetical protein
MFLSSECVGVCPLITICHMISSTTLTRVWRYIIELLYLSHCNAEHFRFGERAGDLFTQEVYDVRCTESLVPVVCYEGTNNAMLDNVSGLFLCNIHIEKLCSPSLWLLFAESVHHKVTLFHWITLAFCDPCYWYYLLSQHQQFIHTHSSGWHPHWEQHKTGWVSAHAGCHYYVDCYTSCELTWQ